MDQAQTTDLKAAKELISQLSQEVTDLRNENVRLQDKVASNGEEEAGDGASMSYDDLLEEIAELKAELQERPSQEEADELQQKIQKYKARKREWEGSVNYLMDEAAAAASERDKETELKERLEWVIEKLRKNLNEKAEALARLESQQPGTFDIREFLRSGVGRLPPRPNPGIVTLEEECIAKATSFTLRCQSKWADKGGQFVVSLPSVIYNGRTHLVGPFPGNIVTGLSYEVFGEDKHDGYYGTYRCTKRVPMGWDVLTSFGQEFVDSFLDRAVVEKGFAAPAIVSLIRQMYETGILKAECFAFQP